MKIAYRSCYLCLTAALFIIAPITIRSQSTDQNFPTAVTGTEIHGVIKARDIGDSRLTSYFYEFAGEQGDVFINVVTKNFTGDIDIFTQEGLKPLTKIVVYASGSADETGRIVYLRKPERLLLRIEGRTPGDDAASFTIKFAGSFVAMRPSRTRTEAAAEPQAPKDLGGVRLSSAGAVISGSGERSNPAEDSTPVRSTHNEAAIAPKKPAKAKPSEETADKNSSQPAVPDVNIPAAKEPDATKPHFDTIDPKKKASDQDAGKSSVIVKDPYPGSKSSPDDAAGNSTSTKKKPVTPPKKAADAAAKADPLASATLVVTMKDGTTFEKPMKDVLRFSAEKGMLTIIVRGEVIRYMLVDVSNIAIR